MKKGILAILPYVYKAILVGAIGLTLHIALLKLIDPIIGAKMEHVAIKQMPYDFYVTFFAYWTAIVPALGMMALYNLLITGEFIQNKARYIKNGLLFSVLFLIAEGQLVRQPIMDALVGNPWSIVLLMIVKTVIPTLVMGIMIAFFFARSAKPPAGQA